MRVRRSSMNPFSSRQPIVSCDMKGLDAAVFHGTKEEETVMNDEQ